MRVTRAIVESLPRGTVLYSTRWRNADGSAVRCRVSGRCKIWVRSPARFSLPVRHGLYESFRIDQDNANEWDTIDRFATSTRRARASGRRP